MITENAKKLINTNKLKKSLISNHISHWFLYRNHQLKLLLSFFIYFYSSLPTHPQNPHKIQKKLKYKIIINVYLCKI